MIAAPVEAHIWESMSIVDTQQRRLWNSTSGRSSRPTAPGRSFAISGGTNLRKGARRRSHHMRALLSTLVAKRRERTVEFELPKIESVADVLKNIVRSYLRLCRRGALTA